MSAFGTKRQFANALGAICYANVRFTAPASRVERNMTAGTDTMRIAVIGAGGVGGSFGAALAKAGNDVTFCVKLWDVESAGATVRPLVGPTTAVIPLQNGIDASERLIPILGKDAVMGGVAQISATVA